MKVKHYSQRKLNKIFTFIVILRLISKGKCQVDIARELGWSKQRINYWKKQLQKEAFIQEEVRSRTKIYEVTSRGKRFLTRSEKAPRWEVFLHGTGLKFPILESSSEFDGLIALLNMLPKTGQRAFGKSTLASFRKNFMQQRQRTAFKLQNPRLNRWKPYPYSPSHKYGYLKALFPYLDHIDLFVVSEPMTIVPYCYSNEYPVDRYDYNPDKFFLGNLRKPLVNEALNIFTSRLAAWIKKFHTLYQLRILILPKNWHLKIFYKSLTKIGISKNEYKVVYLPGPRCAFFPWNISIL